MTNNSINYNESIIPHSLVCIDTTMSTSGQLPGYTGYDFDIPNDFPGSTSALDLYLHLLSIGGTSYFYPPATTNPTTPILVDGNQSIIQSFLNNCLISSGFNANDLIFVVNADNTITIWVSSSYVISGDEFWMGDSLPDGYTNKFFPTIPTTHSYSVGKIQAQLVKYRTAIGDVIDKFYTIGLNPTEIILNGDEVITAGQCNTATDRVLSDHANGCIERIIEIPTLDCSVTTTTYSFSNTDLISFTVNSKDGLGNFNVTQEHVSSRHADWLAMLNQMTVDNTRMEENINSGSVIFNFWEGNISNVVDLSPTQVQFDWKLQPGIYDTPDALITPCIDPISDIAYQNSASTLIPAYDSYPVGTPVSNGGIPIVFTITQYSQINNGSTTSVEYIPAKQVITYNADGTPATDKYYTQGTLTEIVFNTTTDIFKNNCDSITNDT